MSNVVVNHVGLSFSTPFAGHFDQ